MMQGLLPPWVIRKQLMRRLFIRLTVAQTLICLLLFLGYRGLVFSAERVSAQTQMLKTRLDDTRFDEPDRTAERLKSAQLNMAVLSLSPSYFNPEWLRGINAALPEEVSLIEIKADGSRIMLQGITAHWHNASSYRDVLLGLELFNGVRFGAFNKTDDGSIRFELNLWVE